MTQAVIFDLDGTLTDTESSWDAVRRELAAAAGVDYSEADSLAMQGMSTPEWAAYLCHRVGIGASPEQAARLTIDALLARYRTDLPVLPGAVDAVRRLAAHWPLGVASSSPRELIEQALTTLGVRDLITAVRSTEEGDARGKPAPDSYLWVAEQLDADPARCVVVEDSGNGILAGLNAGMKVVAVPPHFLPPSADLLDRVDLVLDDLTGLTVDVVHELTR